MASTASNSAMPAWLSSLPSWVGAVAAGTVGALALLLLIRRRAARQKLPPPDTTPPPADALLAKTPSKKIKEGAAGHAGNFGENGFFFKLETHRFENERAFYERLRGASDRISDCMPEYHGVEERDGKRYLKTRSVVAPFDTASLCIMDVKMGVRCFAESELQSTKPRPDLFEKVLKLGLPELTRSELTAEELATETITKARWMTLRDALSSTCELGFRVDGVVTPTRTRKPPKDLATVRTDSQVVEALSSFLPAARPKAAAQALLQRLGEIEQCLLASDVFATSEIIGSSLLFAADGHGHAGVWLLDFGITGPAEVPGGRLRHDVQWERGSHEDGYLIGVRNLQRLWRRVIEECG